MLYIELRFAAIITHIADFTKNISLLHLLVLILNIYNRVASFCYNVNTKNETNSEVNHEFERIF